MTERQNPYERDLGMLVGRIAQNIVAARDGLDGVGAGGEVVARRTYIAPAIGERLVLSEVGSMAEDTLEVTRYSDGHLYTPYTDFSEDSPPPGMINLAITPGTEILAEWIQEAPAAEAYTVGEWQPLALAGTWEQEGVVVPASRREGERVFLRGAISGGAATEGSALFSVYAEHYPDSAVLLPTLTDSGPTSIGVTSAGAATVGGGAGSGYLLLDSLSWPSSRNTVAPLWLTWGQEDLTFSELTQPFEEFS